MIHDLGVFERAELGVVLHEVEEGSEFGVFRALHNRLNCLAFFERDHLVAGKMNCQAVNSRVHTMHIHLQDSVDCLESGDVAPLKVCLDLIIDLPVVTGPTKRPSARSWPLYTYLCMYLMERMLQQISTLM